MKQLLIHAIIFICFNHVLYSQNTFNHNYGERNIQEVYFSLTQDFNGNFYTIGKNRTPGTIQDSILITKWNQYGYRKEQKTFYIAPQGGHWGQKILPLK